MEKDTYEISPRSGRLRKRIKYRKQRTKKSLKRKLIDIAKHPFVIFIIIALTGAILYLSLQEPAKRNRRKPTIPSEVVNKKIKENRTPEEEEK